MKGSLFGVLSESEIGYLFSAHCAFLRLCLDVLDFHSPSCLEEPAGATHTNVDVNGESTVISSFDVHVVRFLLTNRYGD
ncbi:hypothetical protein GCK32_022448 [Trichostrongylus colubriformis]|uniref:Uncharacterized protein n=1 Tax=Trichostrongylus colubriformis TaxID=6319 RepID=A0AAN8F299_TRICO